MSTSTSAPAPWFDIESLDRLLGGPNLRTPSSRWSACISGPDGIGKSILAMHLAASYARTCQKNSLKNYKLIYVSTDLSLADAKNTWTSFGLSKPHTRVVALSEKYQRKLWQPNTASSPAPELSLDLVPITPRLLEQTTGTPGGSPPENQHQSLDRLFEQSDQPCLYFLDLAEESAGDDWGFINKLLGLLAPGPEVTPSVPHLLIVDAIEGLEILGGNLDAFGERRSRRSRLSQLLRAAKRANTNLALVIEEARPNRKLPEQFVTDLVIRLRQRTIEGYALRTVEIEKYRGVPHARGEHKFVIRSGKGASTGLNDHIDEPRVNRPDDPSKTLPHVHVTPSLHVWNAVVRAQRTTLGAFSNNSPDFGLELLKKLISNNAPSSANLDQSAETIGGGLTLLMGETGTFKSRLARRFLAQGVANEQACILFTTGFLDTDRLQANLAISLADLPEPQSKSSIDPNYLQTFEDQVAKATELKLLQCRRLAARYDSSESFIQMVTAYIREAQRTLATRRKPKPAKTQEPNLAEPQEPIHPDFDHICTTEAGSTTQSHCPMCMTVQNYRLNFYSKDENRIRVVIDDLSVYLAAHPNIADDALFLPSLVFLLKTEGVDALLVATGSARHPFQSDSKVLSDLRRIDERQIVTWTVPFFGQSKVAITDLTPGGQVSGSTIYELRSHVSKPEVVEVDDRFTLYSGLEEGNPRRVPLMVRLFASQHVPAAGENDAFSYSRAIEHALNQIFVGPDQPNSSSTPGRPQPAESPAKGPVVKFESLLEYDRYFSFADLSDDARLDHTLILQIDEFWASHGREQKLLDLGKDYWNAEISPASDPHELFLPMTASPRPPKPLPEFLQITSRNDYPVQQSVTAGTRVIPLVRPTFFVNDAPKWRMPPPPAAPENASAKRQDSIPYLWDFGFLLGRRNLWDRFANEPLGSDAGASSETTIRDVFSALLLDETKLQKVTWADFFAAVTRIGTLAGINPFHVDTSTSESVLSLLLEVWTSVDAVSGTLGAKLGPDAGPSKSQSLKEILAEQDHQQSLFLAATMIVSAFRNCRSERRILSADNPAGGSVAERHWYSTASIALQRPDNDFVVMRLPGEYSMRGDWRLAVAAGSRSPLLAFRALDILNSRRMQLLRLHSGIGLPTRDILNDDQIPNALTALYSSDRVTKERKPMTYGTLLKGAPQPGPGLLKPLFRSNIKDYDRDGFMLRRFFARLIEEREGWNNPSKPYNVHLKPNDFAAGHSDEFSKFQASVAVLIGALPEPSAGK